MATAYRAATLALTMLIPAVPAQAGQTVITSKSPYWNVGVIDEALSRACAMGRFGLKTANRYVARFIGSDGAAVLGIAKGSGLNLNDPGHLAKPNEDYFFYAHGTTSCAVYVGGRKK